MLTLPPSLTDGDLEKLRTSATSNLSSAARHKIPSVKVMVDEADTLKISVRKGYGFCLWSSTQAASICIDGLQSEGYQASFAIRLLRERDDKNMGASGVNRGVGFVRLCRMADSKAQKYESPQPPQSVRSEPPNDQFMRPPPDNTVFNLFYISGDPQQQNYSHDLQMYPADPYPWETARPQIYTPTTTESHPSPGICFS
ncbi:uncharacterized protein MELLADRAFT_66134 [Melampsora larici-populina 98AG31]|uniref:Uncharacterized protein n=1 Tax=Melampsora larici-populina (strain 98AG31 / pathotype 3-4-7) TaxID=747676 RepID=F4RY06_MELLP|nr:uncharacterized protein MELLADRAFT_66134 [Melampsora larici-populina 98AG31]EGG02600.1 hypothetical protein MELLADRAFT_66134 [Melampsora larici-populina 98AG31]